jgi:hypothetical protein
LTWSSRAIATAFLAAAPRAGLSAQTIDTIVVVNHNVFDLQESHAPGFIARLANRLHARTRPGVIRATLLVDAGDAYDSARVAESERALRNLNVFSRVRIDTARLALRVATTDGWSTKPQLGLSSTGGSLTWMVGLVEDNFLGTATSLGAVYNKTPDRSVFDLGYTSQHFLSRRGWLQAKYSDKSDGKKGNWLVGVPFYETAARHAITADGEAASERVLLFKDGAPDTTRDSLRAPQGIVERRALRVRVTAATALRATSRDYVRLWLAGQWRRENFAPESTTAFPRSVSGTAGLGIDVEHVRFQVLERFNSYARREDVDVSQLLHVGVWAAPRAWGYPAGGAGVGPEVSAQIAAPWAGGFAVLRAAGNGVLTTGVPDSGRVSGAFTIASQNLPHHTLILHLEAAALRRSKFGDEFDLWTSQNGPRVWGIHQFNGTRMVWLALEDRLLVADEAWGLVGVGVAPFFDYGGASACRSGSARRARCEATWRSSLSDIASGRRGCLSAGVGGASPSVRA